MKEKIAFTGITVSEFIHPEEEEAKSSLINTAAFKKLISMASDVNLKINKTVIEGTYIRLWEQTAPALFRILRDVCRILDFPDVPELYVCHMMSQMVKPCSSETNYLVLADYVLDTYDEDMLYYTLGNAIAMIMAGHVKMTTVAAYMTQSLWTAIPQIKFKKYLHLADATSDRGGLLACQSLVAAAKCHFFELGMPPKETERLFDTDDEARECIGSYLRAVRAKNRQDGLLTNAAEWWMDMTYVEGPANYMLEELYDWYLDGYQKLIGKYSKNSRRLQG